MTNVLTNRSGISRRDPVGDHACVTLDDRCRKLLLTGLGVPVRLVGGWWLDGMEVRAGASPHVIVGCRAGAGPGW
jgi:hypothetical protein